MAHFLLLSTVAILVGSWWGIARVLGLIHAKDYVRHLVGAVAGVCLAVLYWNMFIFIHNLGNIHNRAWEGDFKAVADFIEQGGDVNEKSGSGGNIVSYAAGSNNVELVNYLISRGANINDTASDGSTPLHYAAREGHVKVIELLISKGANKEARSDNLESENWEEIAHGPYTGTPLHWAVESGQLEAVETLLKAGANPSLADKYGLTPLHEAARQGKKEIAELLFKYGAEVDAKTNGGATPLHIAVNEKSTAMVQLLLEKGADANAKAAFGSMVMEISVPGSREETPVSLSTSDEITKLLRQYGGN